MNLRSIFGGARLKPEWTFTADSSLWRLLCTTDDRIVGECRDPERKKADFFCLDLRTGSPLWKGLALEEPWWVGIEAVFGDIVLLHLYAKPDMPQHKGIRALDVSSGRELWRNDDVTFWFGTGDAVCAYRDFFEKRVAYEIDLASGGVRRSLEDSPDDLGELRSRAVAAQNLDGIVAPEPFNGSTESVEERRIVGKVLKGVEPAGAVDVLRARDLIAVSYHRLSSRKGDAPLFDNHLNVCRVPDGSLLFSDTIGTNLKHPVPDNYFLRYSQLLFLRNQTALSSLRLWRS